MIPNLGERLDYHANMKEKTFDNLLDRVVGCDNCKVSQNEIAYCDEHWDELDSYLRGSASRAKSEVK